MNHATGLVNFSFKVIKWMVNTCPYKNLIPPQLYSACNLTPQVLSFTPTLTKCTCTSEPHKMHYRIPVTQLTSVHAQYNR